MLPVPPLLLIKTYRAVLIIGLLRLILTTKLVAYGRYKLRVCIVGSAVNMGSWGANNCDLSDSSFEITNTSGCYVGGCSGQVCSDRQNDQQNIDTTCEWENEYSCYRGARCERQADNKCGWTMTDTLRSCIDNAR